MILVYKDIIGRSIIARCYITDLLNIDGTDVLQFKCEVK